MTLLVAVNKVWDRNGNPIPNGSDFVQLSQGARQADGTWIVGGADIPNLALTYPDGSALVKLDLKLRSTELFYPSYKETAQEELIAVNNVAPILQLSNANASLNEGDTFVRAGSFIDPGTENWNARVDYGDGTGLQQLALNGRAFELNHTYVQDGNYTVTVRVTDNGNGAHDATDVETFQVFVKNVAPIVAAFTKDGAEDSTSAFRCRFHRKLLRPRRRFTGGASSPCPATDVVSEWSRGVAQQRIDTPSFTW